MGQISLVMALYGCWMRNHAIVTYTNLDPTQFGFKCCETQKKINGQSTDNPRSLILVNQVNLFLTWIDPWHCIVYQAVPQDLLDRSPLTVCPYYLYHVDRLYHQTDLPGDDHHYGFLSAYLPLDRSPMIF